MAESAGRRRGDGEEKGHYRISEWGVMVAVLTLAVSVFVTLLTGVFFFMFALVALPFIITRKKKKPREHG